MPTKLHKVIVVLKLSRHVADVVKTGRAIVSSIGAAKSTFPKPTPPLAQVRAHLDALDAAELAAEKTKAKGAIAAREAAREKVELDLHHLTAYVQLIADAAGPAKAEQVALAAAMHVKKSGAHGKHDFVLHPGDVKGSVHAVVKAAAHRAAYEWQWSSDGGKTWNAAPTTLQANTHLDGLPIATAVVVRHRAVTKDGPGDWSEAVSIVVP